MRNDYFDGLLSPACPATQNQSGAGANPHKHSVTPLAPPAPPEKGEAEKNGRLLCTTYGAGHPDATPPEATPPAAEPWPADLTVKLNRVAGWFEWSPADVRDFRQWAQRSAEGLSDARVFLEHEVAKLPAPGLSDRRRVVLDLLKADPAITVAWTCADDGSDPVTLTVAIRGTGTCELAIPRAKRARSSTRWHCRN